MGDGGGPKEQDAQNGSGKSGGMGPGAGAVIFLVIGLVFFSMMATNPGSVAAPLLGLLCLGAAAYCVVGYVKQKR